MVYGNRYGVPKDQVSDALASGVDVIIKIDVQGAETLKRLNPEAVFVFVAPPSMEELGAPSCATAGASPPSTCSAVWRLLDRSWSACRCSTTSS